MQQESIFKAVFEAFAESEGPVSNKDLYARVRRRTGIAEQAFHQKVPIGRKGTLHSPMERTARWTVQTLRARGLVRQHDGKRGLWALTEEGKHRLHRVQRGRRMVAFSTRMGVALWADCRDALAGLGEPIHLCVTSPPYAIAKPRAYGGVRPAEYVDWMCEVIEPIVRALAPGGSIALDVGNDVFEAGSPARTLIVERLLIALHDRLGLSRMDTLIWHNPSRAPAPAQWASLHRVQLNAGYEPILWLTNDPKRVRSNNQRVLQPHTERHLALIARGGERFEARYADGAYSRRPGKFGNPTAGRIARNVLSFSHSCGSQRVYKARSRALGLPVHGAPMPLALAEFLVAFLSEPGDLVFDPFAGSLTTALAAENLQRRWLASDIHAEYLRGGAERFDDPRISDQLNALFDLNPPPPQQAFVFAAD